MLENDAVLHALLPKGYNTQLEHYPDNFVEMRESHSCKRGLFLPPVLGALIALVQDVVLSEVRVNYQNSL